MIIDKTNLNSKDVPYSLNGEVLLERVFDKMGEFAGFITCTLESCHEMKQATAAQRDGKGWGKYESIIASVDTSSAIMPTLSEYKGMTRKRLDIKLKSTSLLSIENAYRVFTESQNYKDAGYPSDAAPYPFIDSESERRQVSPQKIADATIVRIALLRRKMRDVMQSTDINVCMQESHNLDDINL